LGYDLRRVYTEADFILYADVPAMGNLGELPGNHEYLGPILWSPEVELPAWWDQLPVDKPIVYVTFGSSGKSKLLSVLLRGLADLPISVVAATARRVDPSDVPSNAFIADYLPGEQAARQADLVICNGGSPTTYQALAEGTPVLGIATNLDQHLNMQAVTRAGVGQVLRSEKTTPARVRALVERMLAQPAYQDAAKTMARRIADYDARERFRARVDAMFPGGRAGRQIDGQSAPLAASLSESRQP
jgi:UDP:flavonoid glycosyltransferase YjiC (YdhE family)